MILLLGYRTPSNTEVPEILYLGDDMSEAERVAAETPLPRVGILRNPIVRPLRHWTEEGAARYAESLAGNSATAGNPDVPTRRKRNSGQ